MGQNTNDNDVRMNLNDEKDEDLPPLIEANDSDEEYVDQDEESVEEDVDLEEIDSDEVADLLVEGPERDVNKDKNEVLD